MVIENNLTIIFWNTMGNIISNLPMFFLIIWGVKIIAKELKQGIKNIPKWIEDYDKIKMTYSHTLKGRVS